MTTLQGLVQHVETEPARSFATAAASIAATEVFVAQVAPFLTESGTCTIDIAGVEYTATPDTETKALAVSPALSVAVAEGDPITLVPAAEIKWAYVALDGNDAGDWIQCRVPHELVGYVKFQDGPREPGEGEAVLVETEPEPRIVTMVNQPTSIDATTTPIVVSNAEGESAMVDADGFSTATNDPIPIRTIAGRFGSTFATDGTYIYAADNALSGNIRKFEAATGAEVTTGGFPIATAADPGVTTDGTYLYAINGSFDIVKFDASTGASVGGGFPIAGTFSWPTTDGTYVYAINGSGDIAKYNAATGASVGGGFPIAGTFDRGLTTDGAYLYVVDDVTKDIRKYSAATGVEDTNGYPIALTIAPLGLGTDGTYLFASIVQDIHKYDLATGVEVTTNGFPMGSHLGMPVADDLHLYALGGIRDSYIRVFNNTTNYQSTRTDSSDGTFTGRAISVSDITAAGDMLVEGAASLPNLGNSDQKITASNYTPTSTTNVNMTELDMSVTVGSRSDVVWVQCNPEVLINTAGTNIIELLIDGGANALQLRNGGAANQRVTSGRLWRLTGLAAGDHTIAFRTRSAGATSSTVVGTMTSASYWTST